MVFPVRPKVILLAGPTASGKSAVGVELARRLGGEIVNADSMQVYQELRVLTARPDDDDMQGIPHHLYSIASVAEAFSVARWVKAADQIIFDIVNRDRVPIVVGGTGLYFRALLDGLSAVPEIDPDVRSTVRRSVDENGAEAAHAALVREDPIMAERLSPADGQRIARALEVIRSSGRSLADWQSEVRAGPLAELDQRGLVAKILLSPPRDWLYRRCNDRFDVMLGMGALDEVRALPPTGGNLPALKALGVVPLRAHLEGKCSLDEAVDRAKTVTRQYAKRQMTWFRNQCADWHSIEKKESERIIEFIFSKIIAEGLTP